MYRVLGWDIGIKNLACCLLEANDNTTEIADMKILHWEIINLTDVPDTFLCEDCNKNAKYYKINSNKTKSYFCGVHLKENRKIIKIPKMKKDLAVFGIKLQQALLERKDIFLNNIDKVVIENQPSLQNPFMKSIQMLLYSWFLFNGSDVIMLNANSKTKVYQGPDIEKPKLKSKYSIRKKVGILQCKYMLKENTNALKKLEDNKSKCDDLCDAYLLACYQILKLQSKQ